MDQWPAVSTSLLEATEVPQNWIPPNALLFGIGEPWEPYSFDTCYNDKENDEIFKEALLLIDESEFIVPANNGSSCASVGESACHKTTICSKPSRWGPRQTSNTIAELRKAGALLCGRSGQKAV